MTTKNGKEETEQTEELLEEVAEEEGAFDSLDEEGFFDSSDGEEYDSITLQYTIPGTTHFVRLNLLDAEEERAAFEDMYETCGADFEDYEIV